MGFLDRLMGKKKDEPGQDAHGGHAAQGPPGTAQDPVCKMWVDPKTAQWSSQHGTQRYYFCAPGCQKAFEADPHKYLGAHHSH